MRKEKKYVWVFSLAALDQSVQAVRLTSPFGCFPGEEYEFIYAPSLKAIANIFRVPHAVVFHRILYPLKEMRTISAFARAHHIPIIMEIDDLIIDLPQKHPSYHVYAPIKSEIQDMIGTADFITVTNDRLKAFLAPYNKNICVLPNLIDEKVWCRQAGEARAKRDTIRIGYAGSLPHAYDLAIVVPAIRHILEKYKEKVSCTFIGSIPEALKGMPGVYSVGIINSYRAYAQFLKDQDFDFTFAVLEDNPFSQSKSNMKFLEYSICGYPGIYSRVGPYIDSVTDNGTGILIDNTTEEWIRAMELLINDPALRKKIGENASNHVRQHYSLRQRVSEWYRTYTDIITAGMARERKAFSLAPLTMYGPYLMYAQMRKIFFICYDTIRSLVGMAT